MPVSWHALGSFRWLCWWETHADHGGRRGNDGASGRVEGVVVGEVALGGGQAGGLAVGAATPLLELGITVLA